MLCVMVSGVLAERNITINSQSIDLIVIVGIVYDVDGV